MRISPRQVLFLILALLFVTGVIASSAPLLPTGGAYVLRECSDTDNIVLPEEALVQMGIRQFVPTKPAGLELKIAEKIKNTYFYGLKLGAPARTHWIMAGRSSGGMIDVIYLDANADGSIVPEERIPCEIQHYQGINLKEPLIEYWSTLPIQRLRVPVEYKLADGAVLTREIEITLEIPNPYIPGKALAFSPTASFQALVILETCFFGEIPYGGRLVKVAVADGDGNGVYNDPKNDRLLIDKDGNGIFDWKKEGQALGKMMSGIDPATGKRTWLTPAVAPWPVKLHLVPKGASVTPSQLEAE